MLVTDNDYPRFYGEPDREDTMLYMVVCPGARPVFRFSKVLYYHRVQMSNVHFSEQQLLADLAKGHLLARIAAPPPSVVEKMLQAYQEHRSRHARNGR